METLKSLIWKPDPATQLRKCNQLIRANARQLDRHISQLKQLEAKTKNMIITTSRRKNVQAKETRLLARELVRIRRQSARLSTSKAQLESVGMQVNEAFSVRKIEGSIRASTSVMKDVNSLVRLPELTGTMRELSMELVKAGIIEEMVQDSLPEEDLEELDEEAESEVDKILGEILDKKLKDTGRVPDAQIEEPEVEPQEVVLEGMRERLEALKS
ncbi:Snf7-domain-containing protein [Kalaharituber pfeilii]|nr:Snf7-domain-containing protein [Kalaharituber pfeilii]